MDLETQPLTAVPRRSQARGDPARRCGRAHAACLTLLFLAACRETTPGARDGGRPVVDCSAEPASPQCDEASEENAMFTWSRSLCGFLFECCSTDERWPIAELMVTRPGLQGLLMGEPMLLDDMSACRRGVALSLFNRFGARYRAVDEGRQVFDRDAARECLAWYSAGRSHCAPGLVLLHGDDEPAACRRLFVPTVALEGECFSPDDCADGPDGGTLLCASRTELRADGGVLFSVRGHCTSRPGRGEACAPGALECGPGDFCGADRRCQARAAIGTVCVGAPCAANAYCDIGAVPPRCAARRGPLQVCAASEQCQGGLECLAELRVCYAMPNVHPLDVEFDVCQGSGGTPIARQLGFVPRDGGL